MTLTASQAADRLARLANEMRRNIDTARRGLAAPDNKLLVSEAKALLQEVARAA